MNGDPPIDQETRDGEQITPPPTGTPFDDERTSDEIRYAVQSTLGDLVNAGGSVVEAAAEIELLARRIAISMLESDEFRAKVMEIAWPALSDERRYELLTVIQEAERHQDPTYDRAFLDSSAFAMKVGEIASNMIGQNVPTLLESDEFKLAVCGLIDRSGGKTRSVAEIRLECEHEWADDPSKMMQGGQICRRCGTSRLKSRVFTPPGDLAAAGVPEEIIEIDEHGNVFESSPGATVHTKRPPECDHQWVQNEDVEAGSICRRCGVVRAMEPPIIPVADGVDKQEMAGVPPTPEAK